MDLRPRETKENGQKTNPQYSRVPQGINENNIEKKTNSKPPPPPRNLDVGMLIVFFVEVWDLHKYSVRRSKLR